MDLIGGMQSAHAALAQIREGEAQGIADAMRDQRVVGVLGEAEVGKTETIRQGLRMMRSDARVLYLDLDRAASDEHVGFLLAKQVARALLRGADMSLLSAGALVPAGVDARRTLLAEMLGVEGMEEALREWPSGTYTSAAALRGVEVLSERDDVILWVDHVEAPRLTPRHPVKTDRLLWGIRELSQRTDRVRVLVSAREAARDTIVGKRAAFHQQGRWLSLDCPTPAMWREVAGSLSVSPRTAHELAELTDGHPQTMLLALVMLELADGDWPTRAGDVLAELAAYNEGVARRAVEHAQSLHRLGGQVLIQVARGQRPYAVAQRGSATAQEISKVLGRLRLAGLLRRTDHWAVVNPLVAIRARGTVAEPSDVEAWETLAERPPFSRAQS
jgi:hypothetical protein